MDLAIRTSNKLTNENGVCRRLSTFEALPVEIIQKIFFFALEVNLPRSSLVFARCLSSELIYRVFLLYSFFNEFKPLRVQVSSSAEPTIAKAFRPAPYFSLSDDERKKLQGDVLATRWCTLERVRACIPAVLNLCVQSVWTHNGVVMDSDTERRLQSFDYEGLDQGKATSHDLEPFIGTDVRDNAGLTLEIFSTFKIDIDKEAELDVGLASMPQPLRTNVIHPITFYSFPSKVLCEPWTWDKIRFFHLIRKHRASLFDEGVISLEHSVLIRQSVQRALQNAIQQGNVSLIYALLIMDKSFYEFVKFHSRKEGFIKYPREYAIPPDLFETAMKQSNNSIEVIQMMIRFDTPSVPWKNEDLKSWAESQNNSFGKTMLRLIDKHARGDRHIGRDIAMLMLDPNGSNGKLILTPAARRG